MYHKRTYKDRRIIIIYIAVGAEQKRWPPALVTTGNHRISKGGFVVCR